MTTAPEAAASGEEDDDDRRTRSAACGPAPSSSSGSAPRTSATTSSTWCPPALWGRRSTATSPRWPRSRDRRPLGGAQVFVARHVAAHATKGRPLNATPMLVLQRRLPGRGYRSDRRAPGPRAAHPAGALDRQPLGRRLHGSHHYTVVPRSGPARRAQGRQRFLLVALAMGSAASDANRPRVAFLAAGFGATGAMAATFAASLVGVLILLVPLRHRCRRSEPGGPACRVATWSPSLPVMGGLLAITALSTTTRRGEGRLRQPPGRDLRSASLIGRVVLYLPAAIVTVVFPKVSARVAADGDTRTSSRRALPSPPCSAWRHDGVRAGAHPIVRVAFGSEYAAAHPSAGCSGWR